MSRERLPEKRPSVNVRAKHVLESGKEFSLLVTLGFELPAPALTPRVREVFCADFKAGTDMHSVVVDASILASLLLQHGYRPLELAERLTDPGSIVGTIIRAAAQFEREEGGGEEPKAV